MASPPTHQQEQSKIKSVAIAFLLLVLTSFLPLLYCAYNAEEEEKKKSRAVETAESISNIILQVCRRQKNKGTQRKQRRVVSKVHGRARQAVLADYLSPNSLFNDCQFERIFRISKKIMQQLIDVCGKSDPFLMELSDPPGRFNICPKEKNLMALKVLAFGCSPIAFVDYFQMSESTGRSSVIKFCKIVSSDESLTSIFARKMRRGDARRVSRLHEEAHGVAGMIGSLDCMRICWKNCRVAWQGVQIGKSGKPTTVLEAFANHNLWFGIHPLVGLVSCTTSINGTRAVF